INNMLRGPAVIGKPPSTQSADQLEKLLRTDVISVTLKFGFQQKPFKYSLNDTSYLIIEKIYRDAETWLRSIGINLKNLPTAERYTLYLFRIPTTDLTMVPIVQLSDIEQNSSIELIIVPVEVNLNPHALYRCQLNVPTNYTLKLATNFSAISSPGQPARQSTDVDIVFPLGDINDLILTHFVDERDHIFEIYFQNKFALCVGKKSDSDDLQMQTAQFYSSIRDQWESLASGPSSHSQPASTIATTPPTPATSVTTKAAGDLRRKRSIYRRPPCGIDNEDKDLHELYTFTGEKIGEGQFGRVVGAIRKSTNRKVAIKCIEKANCSEEDIRRTNEEIDYLYKFNHVNILKLEAYFERGDAVYIITERMETDMCKYIMESQNKWLDENMSKMLIYQVIIALRYLHSNNCGHLDVKCENILISFLKPIPANSNTGRSNQTKYKHDLPLVKLADFGYSRIIGEHSFRKTRVGTKVYCAPEIYRSKEGYNRLVDMWSVGIVLYAALSGTLPYDEKDVHRAEEIVRNRKLFFSQSRWKDITDEAIDLISNKLLVVQANTRIRSTEALFHAWFTDFHLYKKLREIEARTEYDLASKQQQLTSTVTWLTGEREDPAWMEYKSMYDKSNE
ncbi:unnamed protein product, partial [Rotaria magnacalcarata]